jgi:hypothetical protein
MDKDNDTNTLVDVLIEYLKDEVLKSNISTDIIKTLSVYLLYIVIPTILFIILINFLTTLLAVFIVFNSRQ